ncbi:hypothetical protein JRQ81_014821 [Phrynocephalus forsythii]|uniref:EF-hand domain-containing protein n=1 Tax=Phrynocephalus forsythii TaxID=171643 RepID=A0A9Q1B3F9_9SAUR|nr:hypothetical protein JRQ81_014821 [Phrynocephalus forsythii]
MPTSSLQCPPALMFTKAFLLEIFEMIDLDGNGFLSLEEYNFFEMRTSGEKCDEEACAICRCKSDNDQDAKIASLFLQIFRQLAENLNELLPSSPLLETAVIQIFANTSELCCHPVHLSANLLDPRHRGQQLIEEEGSSAFDTIMDVVNKIPDIDEVVIINNVAKYHAKENFGAKSSSSESKAIVHLNCEKNKNCMNSRGSNAFAIEVASKSMMICHHVMLLNDKEEWIYNCDYSILS